jgi:hypothetical protein
MNVFNGEWMDLHEQASNDQDKHCNRNSTKRSNVVRPAVHLFGRAFASPNLANPVSNPYFFQMLCDTGADGAIEDSKDVRCGRGLFN